MFGVRERLELPRVGTVPSAEGIGFRRVREDFRQEFCLRAKIFRYQPGILAGFSDGGKIDVRRQILLANICQDVVADVMPEIGAERAVCARGRKQFVRCEAVIHRQ